ncbi:unnamed protein product [Acanthoscelides obtectus]|uniref:DDE-1 domain-containing protein n=1 Tax=Acanthoscelides obtectus TaxID=200917 RepID=A0A9P0K3X1_ACAOB|nr:unnamed protein product [Acanthoscelides obtectus]CAK1667431.1 hypothetical protein AOBTE_LOCUS25837 [Acanthoscelides obtectus]
MEDRSRDYYCDETGFQVFPNTGKVYAAKGAKNIYTVEKGSPKENITVMFSFSASGITCPPMIIYRYKRIPEKISLTVNPDWGVGRSDNVDKDTTFPIVLFLDGHESYLTYELSLLCNDLNIEDSFVP